MDKITYPGLDYLKFAYDARGNVTERRHVAKPGTTPAVQDIVESATFDGTCSNPVTCNSPNSTTDARGYVTTYEYDPVHGGVTKITRPTATGTTSDIHPETRFTYTRLGANGAASSTGIWMLTGSSSCITTTSCAGTLDEVKSTLTFGQGLRIATATTGAGDASLGATVAYGYDAVGNQTWIDGPLAGTADRVYSRYDADRRALGTVSPDPDGTGAMLPRATRINYNTDGTVLSTEVGTDTSPSSAGFGGFTSLQTKSVTYDNMKRPIQQVFSAAGTTYRIMQFSYDSIGRLDCTALRMNPATWSSLPASACALAASGAAGPDRISKQTYKDNNLPLTLQVGVGTSDAAIDRSFTYTATGALATVTDAENNTTGYGYDGFDRPITTNYPNPTKGSGVISSTDYEQLTLDPAGNVTARRLRDNSSITFAYDNLGRLKAKSLPGSEGIVNFSYDLQGRLTSVNRATDGVYSNFSYDALGRMLSEAQSFGTVSYQYDIAGNRTRLTWSDGNYVGYDHLITGEISAIRENGAASGVGVLASYAYDNLGRKTSITRGNGTVTSYGYDSGSELISLNQDLAGTTYDQAITFTYNSAGQIASQVRSNDIYAWNGHYNVDRAYGTNGLNQLSSAGSAALGYDPKGNLTSSGSTTYTYSSENLLKSATGGPTLHYDALGRLQEYDTSVSTRFYYDGGHIAAEVANPSSAVLRRYVYGPGDDEPLVWYEGASMTDRRWLHADERGSVIATTDSSGNPIGNGINRYDEYGIPSSTNTGRFQYTGQAWLSELGMSYYKARIYSPSLGRFMQTDPIGYNDGMNWYNYVGGDPVNAVDPSGLLTVTCADGSKASSAAGCDGHGGLNKTDGGPTPGRVPGNVTDDISSCRPPGCYVNFPDGTNRWVPISQGGSLNASLQVIGWSIPPAEPLNGMVNGAGTGAGYGGALMSGVQYGAALAGATTVGNNLKRYANGWRGHQYVKTFNIGKIAGRIGFGAALISTAADFTRWENGNLSGGKFAANLIMTGVGFAGPGGAALSVIYFGVDQAFPGKIDALINDITGY